MQEDFHQELVRLFNANSKDISSMKQLLFQSYSFRRDSIKKNSTIFSELLSDFPYFQLDELREEEFSSIIEMKTTKVADKIVKIMNNLWAYYSTSSNDVTSGSIDIVKRLEKEIKVKHKKAETIFYTGKDLDLNLISAPRIFIQSKKMSIVYKSTILFNIYDSPKFEDVMCILFSFYFIFDLQYPDVFAQILSIFHLLLFPFEECKYEKTPAILKIIDYLKE